MAKPLSRPLKFPVPPFKPVQGGTVDTLEHDGYPFRRFRMEQLDIDPQYAKIFRVRGDSMSPTLPDSSVIMIDYQRTYPRDNCMYVFRSDGTLLVKRAKRDGQWWFHSDNPEWAPIQLTEDMDIWGQVRWVGHRFSDQGF